jgi:hypothetical protein
MKLSTPITKFTPPPVSPKMAYKIFLRLEARKKLTDREDKLYQTAMEILIHAGLILSIMQTNTADYDDLVEMEKIRWKYPDQTFIFSDKKMKVGIKK